MTEKRARAGTSFWVRLVPEALLLELLELEPRADDPRPRPNLKATYLLLCLHLARSKDDLPDDDRLLARLTDAGKAWPAHKARLIERELIGVRDGKVHVPWVSHRVRQALRALSGVPPHVQEYARVLHDAGASQETARRGLEALGDLTPDVETYLANLWSLGRDEAV